MSPFSLSSLILCLSSIVFSTIVYRSDEKNHVSRDWFIFSIPFSLWALSLFAITSTSRESTALIWQFILDISAILIPVLYLHFTHSLLESSQKWQKWLAWTLSLSMIMFSFTPLFKNGVRFINEFDFFWINPGPFYWIFPVYFVGIVLIAILNLILGYIKHKTEITLRAQIRNTLISGVIGYIGGLTNFFPQIFNIYPFGNYLVILYIVFMVYGVLKYKLLSTQVISAHLFSTALLLALLVNLLSSREIKQWTSSFLLFAFACLISALLIRSVNKEVKTRQEIEKLATDLSVANDRLKELDAQKTEFVSLASHQLRGPLTAIKGYGSMLLEGDFGELSPMIKDAVEKMYKSTNDLVVIVGDYLDVSRIEQGRMQYDFSRFDLKELVSTVVTELRPNVENAHLTLDFDTSPAPNYTTHADKGKIKQVISNIVDNAIKYTPKGGIHIWLSTKTKDKALISISDTGVGIHPDVIPKLFQKFTRAPNASETNILGTGLGLYVAKKMIEAHNGRVWAESAGQGKGSTFFIELDLVDPYAPNTLPTTPTQSTTTNSIPETQVNATEKPVA